MQRSCASLVIAVVAVAFAVAVVVVVVVVSVEVVAEASVCHCGQWSWFCGQCVQYWNKNPAHRTFVLCWTSVDYAIFAVSAVVVVFVVVSVVVFVVGFVVILPPRFAYVGIFWQIWGKDSFHEKILSVVSCGTQWFYWFHSRLEDCKCL